MEGSIIEEKLSEKTWEIFQRLPKKTEINFETCFSILSKWLTKVGGAVTR